MAIYRYRRVVLMTLAILSAAALLRAADPPAKGNEKPEATQADAPKTKAASSDSGPATAAGVEYEKQFVEWKKILGQLRVLQGKLQGPETGDTEKQREQFKELVKQARAMLPTIGAAAEKAFISDPKKYSEAGDFLLGRIGDEMKDDKYDEALRLAKVLIDNDHASDYVYTMAGEAAFSDNQFDDAVGYLLKIKSGNSQAYQQMLDKSKQASVAWKAEQKIREKEAKADDLPRVKITTSKGDIVIELFENEAPNTTANFINLVEKKYYDGVKFHRVIGRFMAQTGDPKGDGTGGPGYTIACECYEPNARNHFRGSLSMAKQEARDTGGSQFFLTFTPTDRLNGKHTVFGRIVEGMDVLEKLQRTEENGVPTEADPDKIIKATVLRKRNHEYVPKKVGDK